MPDSFESSLDQWADAAFREVAIDLVRRAKQTGIPIVVWEDGKVRHVRPEELSEEYPHYRPLGPDAEPPQAATGMPA